MNLSSWPESPHAHGELDHWLKSVEVTAGEDQKRWRRNASLWAWGRFFTFATIPVGIYLFFGAAKPLGIALALIGLPLFVAAIRRHERATRAANAAEQILMVTQESRRRVPGDPIIIRSGLEPDQLPLWSRLFGSADNCTESERLSPQEIDDLDLYGEKLSLFGLLNRSSTPAGASRLAMAITAPPMNRELINASQTAVRALAQDHKTRLRLMAAASTVRPMEPAFALLFNAIQGDSPIENNSIARVIRYWGAAGPIAFLVGAAATFGWVNIPVGWLPLIVVLIVNAIVIPSFLRGVRERLRPWLELEPVTAALRQCIESSTQIIPDTDVLKALRRKFAAALESGGISSLHRRIPFVYLGLAGILHTIIDVFCLWDLQVLLLIQRCTLKEKDRLLDAMAAVGELEMYCCLAAFSAEQPGTTWPDVEDGPPHLSIREGRHPLVGNQVAVPNSLELGRDENTWLITGSNMSGKSTFLRMTGVNVILARAGSAVSAEQMSLTPLQILTDLRIRDDLSRKESYFLAEVRQVKRMVENGRSGVPMLALIDEPFRGTNSAERVAAAGAVISSLMRGGGLHLIATHDAILAGIVAQEGGGNYHFEEQIEQNQMVFDYKLRPGQAKGRNALRVLEVEAYPADVLSRAREIAGQLGRTDPTAQMLRD